MTTLLLKLLQPVQSFIARFLIAEQDRTSLLPLWYFYKLGFVVPRSAAELLVFRFRNGVQELFLTQREATDPYWPSAWHFPGTIVRKTDTMDRVRSRLAAELGLTELPGELRVVAFDLTHNPRGHETHTFHTLTVSSETEFPTGSFHPVDSLPPNIIPHQRPQIPMVAAQILPPNA